MASKRKIIQIDEKKCDGCGQCVPNCQEGALQIVDGKARLISDLFCDGLGACIGHCPKGAITIIERAAKPYDERKVMQKNIVPKGETTIKAHLEHLRDHNATEYLNQALGYLKEKKIKNPLLEERTKVPCGCPGTMMQNFGPKKINNNSSSTQTAELRQWPIQLHLVNPAAPYFRNNELLIAADCVPFAYASFHSDFLKGRPVVIACPKLDQTEGYAKKISDIIKIGGVKKIIIAHMEVPCCFGLEGIAQEAVRKSGKKVDVEAKVISVGGEIQK